MQWTAILGKTYMLFILTLQENIIIIQESTGQGRMEDCHSKSAAHHVLYCQTVKMFAGIALPDGTSSAVQWTTSITRGQPRPDRLTSWQGRRLSSG